MQENYFDLFEELLSLPCRLSSYDLSVALLNKLNYLCLKIGLTVAMSRFDLK